MGDDRKAAGLRRHGGFLRVRCTTPPPKGGRITCKRRLRHPVAKTVRGRVPFAAWCAALAGTGQQSSQMTLAELRNTPPWICSPRCSSATAPPTRPAGRDGNAAGVRARRYEGSLCSAALPKGGICWPGAAAGVGHCRLPSAWPPTWGPRSCGQAPGTDRTCPAAC